MCFFCFFFLRSPKKDFWQLGNWVRGRCVCVCKGGVRWSLPQWETGAAWNLSHRGCSISRWSREVPWVKGLLSDCSSLELSRWYTLEWRPEISSNSEPEKVRMRSLMGQVSFPVRFTWGQKSEQLIPSLPRAELLLSPPVLQAFSLGALCWVLMLTGHLRYLDV